MLLWALGVVAAWRLDRERVDREVQEELARMSILASAGRQRFFSASDFWFDHLVRRADGGLELDAGAPALRAACERLRAAGGRSALVLADRRWTCAPGSVGAPPTGAPDAVDRAGLAAMAGLTRGARDDATRLTLRPGDTAPVWLAAVWDSAPGATGAATAERVVGHVRLEMPVAVLMEAATSPWEHSGRVQYRALGLGSAGAPTRVLWSRGALPAGRAYTDSLGAGFVGLDGAPVPMRLYASQALPPIAPAVATTALTLAALFGTLWWLSWRLLVSRARLAEVLARRTARAQHRQRALAESRQANRALAGAARQAGAAVRQRLGAELHDHTGQLLTAAQLQARHLALVVEPALQPACEILADTLRDAAASVRDLAHDCHREPTREADAPDLLAALRQLAERARPLPVELIAPAELPPLGPDARLALLRIAQEAVGNALRHAGASALRLWLAPRPDELLRIEDNGIGFDASRATGGLGLVSMQERAATLGARLAVGRDGDWTQVRVTTGLQAA